MILEKRLLTEAMPSMTDSANYMNTSESKVTSCGVLNAPDLFPEYQGKADTGGRAISPTLQWLRCEVNLGLKYVAG
jgi:hypothetical protein